MQKETTSLFDLMGRSSHQNVLICNDNEIGLKAIVAIHDTTLGPAIGGVRMLPYDSEAEAIQDALRLSKAITYKAALAGLNVGGGSAIIIGNNRTEKTEVLMRRFGRFINGLNGNFIASIDVRSEERRVGKEYSFQEYTRH